MDSTSVSLLQRLRQGDQPTAWERFVELYAPLIYHWSRGQGLNATDAADLVQDVLTLLVSKLPQFEHDPSQRFRGWLRTVTVNKVRDFQRRAAVRSPSGVAVVPTTASNVDLFEEAEYRSFIVNRALTMMKSEFPEHAWQACWRVVVEGQSAAEAARDLGLTENAVYVAKSRILRRLREELTDLLD